ncbi:20730_t:CDS:2, partial [Racocetra persica]
RLLDTQFRLLREDMMCPMRLGIENFIKFISKSAKNNAKFQKLQEHGGKHKYDDKEGMDGGDLNVYANVHFSDINVNLRRGFSCRMGFTQPKMRRNLDSKQGRSQYWNKSSKLMNGSLVCLLWPSENSSPNDNIQFSLFFGTVLSRDEDLLSRNQHVALVDISFIDSLVYRIALEEIKKKNSGNPNEQTTRCFMVESIGAAYFHILKALQTTLPSNLPFEKYLAPQIIESSSFAAVDPPTYARAPGFVFDLSVLLENKNKRLLLNAADTSSHETVIQNLQELSRLDNTQAQSLVYSLCREVALIEGPPGTGKTFVGIEIMKALLANQKATKLGPILTICFTNHALDQFLENLLKVGIKKIVRIGSRSKSEIIENFSIDKLCPNRPTSRIQREILGQGYDELEKIQKDSKKILKNFSSRWLDWDNIASYLVSEYPDHWRMFQYPDIPSFLLETNDNETEWQLVNNKKQQVNNKRSIFCQWICGSDLDLAQKWTDNFQIQEIEHNITNNSNMFETLRYLDSEEGSSTENNTDIENDIENTENTENPNENIENTNENPENTNDYYISYIQDYLLSWEKPEGDRHLEYLKTDPNVWQMSMAERIKLHDFWKENIQLDCLDELSRIKEQHEKKKNEIDKVYNENRRRFLLNCDVIGMTTNGAAKFQTLISSIEAGEVLEAHILSALTSKTQHMILIGDHNQRLVNGDQAMRLEKSQLHTQRRMRGEISDLIRYTLYNDLVDEEKVVNYPNVRGAQKNVYFVDHRNSEDSGENEFAMNSHSNTYEAKMVVEMVK